jgi:hypothetical protein
VINEVTDEDISSLQVRMVGIITQLYGRIVETGTRKPYSLDALLMMLSEQGVPLNAEQFREMIQVPPLSNLISNVKGNKVIFKGQNDVSGNTDLESPDASSDTLDKMAKRAAKKRD